MRPKASRSPPSVSATNAASSERALMMAFIIPTIYVWNGALEVTRKIGTRASPAKKAWPSGTPLPLAASDRDGPRGAQLNPLAVRRLPRNGDRQVPSDSDLAQRGARRGDLARRHVAVGGQVGGYVGEIG